MVSKYVYLKINGFQKKRIFRIEKIDYYATTPAWKCVQKSEKKNYLNLEKILISVVFNDKVSDWKAEYAVDICLENLSQNYLFMK